MKFVLVHGGWQGGWCWDDVAALLRDLGHQVLAPTLRGSEADSIQVGTSGCGGAKDPRPVDRDVDLDTVGEDLVSRILDTGWIDIVLVGHSGGGPIVQYAADRLLSRVKRIVFIDAWVLMSGEATIDVWPSADAVRALAERRSKPFIMIDRKRWRDDFMNGAASDLIDNTITRLVPLPWRQLSQSIHLPQLNLTSLSSDDPDGGPPTSYIFLRHDRSVDPAIWRRMAARLHSPFLVECDGPHEAMITNPGDLTQALLTATFRNHEAG